MTATTRALTALIVAGVLAPTVAACAPAAGGDEASQRFFSVAQNAATLPEDEQLGALSELSRLSGVALIEASGLPEELGMTAEEIEAALPRATGDLRAPSPVEAAPAEPAAPAEGDSGDMGDPVPLGPDDLGFTQEELDELLGEVQIAPSSLPESPIEGGSASMPVKRARIAVAPRADVDVKEAAMDGVRNMVEQIWHSMDEAEVRGQNYEASGEIEGWKRSEGYTDGFSTSLVSRTDTTKVGGVDVTTATFVSSELQACPAKDGSFDAILSVTSSVTRPGPDGKSATTQMELTIDLLGTVDDNAWLVRASSDWEAKIRKGAPGSGPGVLTGASTSAAYYGTSKVEFEKGKGAYHPANARVENPQGAVELAALSEDMVARLQQVAVVTAENFWRSGACVDAVVVASPDAIGNRETSKLTVTAASRVGQGRIAKAKAEYTFRNEGSAGGEVTGKTPQTTAATFTYKAVGRDGIAQPQFRVTSRQGVGLGYGVVTVGQSGWVIDGVRNDVHYYAQKCDGLVGTWYMTAEGPYGYAAESEFSLDETLRGTYGATIVGGYSDAGDVWLEGEAGTYVFHATGDFDPAIPLRPATNGECN